VKIVGIEGLSDEQVLAEVALGGRFVVYQYCISILVMTFKRPSDIHFVRGHENRVVKGLGFSLVSTVLGWWGIPWGPIHTVSSMWNNFSGGIDVTQDILNRIRPPLESGVSAYRAAA
jgi:hypothetical protein